MEKRRDNKGRILRENEFQRPDGRYQFRYYNSFGEMKYEYSWKLVPTDSVPSGKRDCLSLREKEDSIKEDLIKGINTDAKKKYTLNDIYDKYISGKTELKPSTLNNYNYMYNNYVRDSFGRRKISDIKYSDIKEFYTSLIVKNEFQPNTVEIIHTLLHPTFTLAVRDDIIVKNPTEFAMSDIKKSHNWKKKKRRALTLDEQNAFMNFIDNNDLYAHWAPLFTVLLGTGLRIGELLGLTWNDIDQQNKQIIVSRNLTYRQQSNGKCEKHISTPKTEAGIRIIPMLNEVNEAFNELRRRQIRSGHRAASIDSISNFIFLGRDGEVLSSNAVNRALKRIIKAYNEEEIKLAQQENQEQLILPDFSVHQLRHTFCTRLCENGTNIKIIQDIMGHSDFSTTMNIYAEVTNSKKQEAFTYLENLNIIRPDKKRTG